MYSTDDTIVAIATPVGHGGIGIVRLSGPQALAIACSILHRKTPLQPRQATLARAFQSRAADSPAIDQVLATYFKAPASYTGEDVVELSAHGSPIVLERMVTAAIDTGARLAEPGEFTLRAFLKGRLDLVQAEAVADLVDAVTPAQARVAFDQLDGTLTTTIAQIDTELFDLVSRLEASLDFPDEGYHFVDPSTAIATIRSIAERVETLLATGRSNRVVREGRQVVILGKPNTGKSSLFNELIGVDRAIVTTVAGTTRDLVTETVDLQGVPVRLVDTAGLHLAKDPVEAEGVARARQAGQVADLQVLVFDRSRPLDQHDEALLEDTANARRLFVVNKIDLPPLWSTERLTSAPGHGVVETSMVDQEGLDGLRPAIVQALGVDAPQRDSSSISNIRHLELLERVRDALRKGAQSASEGVSEEFILVDLRDARLALEEITGARAPDDLLNHIFQRFCIGK
jgi:tRNA modification GTPase